MPLVFLSLIMAFVCACAPSQQQKSLSNNNPSAKQVSKPERDIIVEGQLSYREVAWGKTWDSFNKGGVNYFLTDLNGNEHFILPSDKVSLEALSEAQGKNCQITCEMQYDDLQRAEGTAYPINEDGTPKAKTPRCQAQKLEIKTFSNSFLETVW